MTRQIELERAFGKKFVTSCAPLVIATSILFGLPNALLEAQTEAAHAAVADRKMAFDVASVRPSKDDGPL